MARTTQRIRRRSALLAATALAGTVLVSGPAPGPATAEPELASGTSTTVTFTDTGATQTWTVPAGVTEATFDVYGGQGAKKAFDGGLGGRATAPIAVTPGDTITINVGGMGGTIDTISCVLLDGQNHIGPGGFNGGGDGGFGCSSAGGGGASDVRVGGTDLDDRVLVAGGGGGGAGNLVCNGAGSGGGLVGGSATANILCSGGGVGGNQDGSAGSGQSGVGSAGSDQAGLAGAGSGGGGGYFGGSGGQPSLGGGGGSGFGPVGTVFENGVRSGGGVVTVSYGAAPHVTGLLPTSGAVSSLVQVVGDNFLPGSTSVTFGGVPAQVQSCTTTVCNVRAPSGTGTVSVRVTAGSEQSLDTPADDFTYIPPPAITGISPTSGPPGTTVTIQGVGFVTTPGFNDIEFGNVTATSSCSSSTSCTAIAPDGVGALEVFVVNPGGSSNAVPFALLPAVTAISPGRGLPAGGTVVTITGSGFDTAAGATAIVFGSTPATAVGCQSSTTCTAVSPPGTGTVDIRVTAHGLTSAVDPADQFTYAAPLGETGPTTTSSSVPGSTGVTTTTATTSASAVAASPQYTG